MKIICEYYENQTREWVQLTFLPHFIVSLEYLNLNVDIVLNLPITTVNLPSQFPKRSMSLKLKSTPLSLFGGDDVMERIYERLRPSVSTTYYAATPGIKVFRWRWSRPVGVFSLTQLFNQVRGFITLSTEHLNVWIDGLPRTILLKSRRCDGVHASCDDVFLSVFSSEIGELCWLIQWRPLGNVGPNGGDELGPPKALGRVRAPRLNNNRIVYRN